MKDLDETWGLLDLNDDILFEVIAAVAATDHVARHSPQNRQRATAPLNLPLLNVFCMTCKHIRLLAHSKLYHTVAISIRMNENLDPLGLLHSLSQSVLAHKHVRNIEVALTDNVKDIATCAMQLVELLQRLSNLESVAVIISPNKKPDFMSGIPVSHLQFKSVTRASLSHGQESLVAWFPNLSSLSVDGTRNGPFRAGRTGRLLEVLDQAPDLRHFEYLSFWDENYLEDLRAHAPQLQTIGVVKSRSGHSFMSLLSYLGRFEQLTSLSVAPVRFLGMGLPVFICGNMFNGPGGAEAKNEMSRKIETIQYRVAKEAFKACKRLEMLRIGSNIEVKRTKPGDIETES